MLAILIVLTQRHRDYLLFITLTDASMRKCIIILSSVVCSVWLGVLFLQLTLDKEESTLKESELLVKVAKIGYYHNLYERVILSCLAKSIVRVDNRTMICEIRDLKESEIDYD
jgi:hypothetical protein